MDLQREPDPKPAPPPEATGAVIEKRKVKVLLLAAVAVGLVIASFLTWLLRPRAVVEQRSMSLPAANRVPPKQARALDEEAERRYEDQRRIFELRSNPAFNLNTSGRPETSAEVRTPPVAAVQKRTPTDAYEDLLAKAAEADSAVEGGKDERHNSVTQRVDDIEHRSERVSGHDGHSVDNSGDGRSAVGNRKGLSQVPQNMLPAGTFIDHCVLVNKLNGEYVGPVKVQVSNDVFNPITYDLVIPQGSTFLGEAQRVSAQFQQRLAVTFDRLQITRDGKLYEIALDKIPGLDQQGATALKDKVDNHYLQIFGASLAIGAIGGLAQIGQGSYGGYGGYDTETQIRNGISQTMAQNASQILNKFLNRLPTVEIRPGTPVLIYLRFGVELQ